MEIAFLAVAQALGAVLLGAVGLFSGFQKPGGGLNQRGYLFFGLGAAVFLIASAFSQVLNSAESDRKDRQIRQLLDKYFSAESELVMKTPKAPSAPLPTTAGQAITITVPPDGSEVDQKSLVEGTVSDSSQEVWVVVHPLDTSSYWLQPRVSVHSSGLWNSMAYFGRSGDLDKGKRFEVVAIAGPYDTLQEGEYGSTWPRARWTSKPITVTRR